MQRYIDRTANAAELVIITEALKTLSLTDSDTYGKIKKIKGHFVTDANVEIYIDFDFKTELLNLKKNPEGGEWEALFDAANGTENKVRNQWRQLTRSWTSLTL
jgi:hypothetical protein